MKNLYHLRCWRAIARNTGKTLDKTLAGWCGGGQRILFQVTRQERGSGAPPPPRQPYPGGWFSIDTVSGSASPAPGWNLPCTAIRLSPITARSLSGREVGAFSIQGRKCLCDTMRQGRFSMDTMLCRYLCWYQHNSITGTCFCPSPPGWRKRTFALCGVTEPWCSGSRLPAAMPG